MNIIAKCTEKYKMQTLKNSVIRENDKTRLNFFFQNLTARLTWTKLTDLDNMDKIRQIWTKLTYLDKIDIMDKIDNWTHN